MRWFHLMLFMSKIFEQDLQDLLEAPSRKKDLWIVKLPHWSLVPASIWLVTATYCSKMVQILVCSDVFWSCKSSCKLSGQKSRHRNYPLLITSHHLSSSGRRAFANCLAERSSSSVSTSTLSLSLCRLMSFDPSRSKPPPNPNTLNFSESHAMPWWLWHCPLNKSNVHIAEQPNSHKISCGHQACAKNVEIWVEGNSGIMLGC